MIRLKNPLIISLLIFILFMFVILIIFLSKLLAFTSFLSLLLGNLYAFANLTLGLLFIQIGLKKTDKIYVNYKTNNRFYDFSETVAINRGWNIKFVQT